ncbi:MAG: SDR family oxidoreductase [Bryobacteraceae bacterium]|nr:SDR family oxidoreductase [Bryobacteraceae bacterium]
MINFHGQTIAITGGASGIGAATAALLREHGATVHIFDLPEVDVTRRATLAAAFAALGPLDAVIANAGIGRPVSTDETTDEEFARTLDVNLAGVFRTLQLAAAHMKPQRRGAIVLTASTNSYDGEADLMAYNASKAGVLGLLHTAANELGPWGIRVNAVCPGLIRTPLTRSSFASPETLKEYFRAIPLGRGGEASEVAQAIAFLASSAASYITGAALLVDGGQMCTKFGTWNEERATFDGDHWSLR